MIVVAAEKCIYMFKLRKKYNRFNFSSKEMDESEYSMWKSYDGDVEGLKTFLVALNELKSSGIELSHQSLNILMLETLEEQL